FFYLVRPQCLPKSLGNISPAITFAYLSHTQTLSPDLVRASWKTRVLAPAISSWLLDTQIKEKVDVQPQKYHSFQDLIKSQEFQNVFGFYHASWLFLLFLAIIYFRRDALFLILAVFAGLMYNLIVPAGMYYYPWDMPALFFFTLACLLYD